jgi:DNA mismatch repair protein MutS2
MPFSPGQAVLIRALNRHGHVLARQGAGYRVSVGGLSMTCGEDELRAVEPERRRKGARASSPPPDPSPPPDAAARSSVDLHGHTVEEAREALLRHLDAALRQGHAVVEVIHGIGTGKVKAAVLKELKGIAAVRAVRPHPSNPGVTLVYL